MKIEATKVEHKGEPRILLKFAYNKEVNEKIRKITGATWSKTLGAWHIPYTKEAFGQLLKVCPETEYPHHDYKEEVKLAESLNITTDRLK